MTIINDLYWRYATKKFNPELTVPDHLIETIKESIRLAPSSFGLQPWRVKIIQDRKIRKELGQYSFNQQQVVEASHLIVICRPSNFTQKDIQSFLQLNREVRKGSHSENSYEGLKNMLHHFLESNEPKAIETWMINQSYLLLGHILVILAKLRIDSCPMEGFEPEKYDKILEFDQNGLRSVLACPIGFRSESDRYAQLEKVRYPLEHYFL